MTFLHLAIRNAMRKPLRAVLLIVCIATTVLIQGLTTSFVHGSQSAAGSSKDLLGVIHAAGMGHPMPTSHLARIQGVEGVASAAYVARLRGHAGTAHDAVPLSMTHPREMAAVNGEQLGLTPDLLAALEGARENVLVGRALAAAQGWEVGDRMGFVSDAPIAGDGTRDLPLRVAGIFEGEGPGTDTYFTLGQYDYLNARRDRDEDTATVFVVRPEDGVDVPRLAVRIDALFANSATPTRTQSEKQFLEAFLRQYADIGTIVRLVVGASFVTLMMIVVNTMILAVRERYFEIGVLKSIGFSRARIMALVLGEVVFIFLVGGGIGLALSVLAARLAGPELGLAFPPDALLQSLGIVVALALAAGLLPTLKAMRIPVIAAFRTR